MNGQKTQKNVETKACPPLFLMVDHDLGRHLFPDSPKLNKATVDNRSSINPLLNM